MEVTTDSDAIAKDPHPQAITEADLLAALAEGADVVTGSQRLARRLGEAFAARQVEQGQGVWPTPRLVTWLGWLQDCWQSVSEARLLQGSTDQPLLLTPAQCLSLWRQILDDDPKARAQLLNLPATLDQVAEAWSLIQQWRISEADLGAYPTPEAEALKDWAAGFLDRCNRNAWLDPDRLALVLSERFDDASVATPAKLLLVGFDELTPQQRQLIAVLRRHGCDCRWLDLEQPARTAARRLSLTDSAREMQTAARWARALLADPEAGQTRVGIVVPDLAASKPALETIFTEVFCPVEGPEGLAQWVNFSYGQALSDWPVVDTALALLELVVRRQLAQPRSSELLRSPFLRAAEDEQANRVAADLALRRPGASRTSFGGLLRAGEAGGCTVLVQALRAEDDEAWSGRQPVRIWATRFAAVLGRFGWPGQRTLSSAEYQTVNAFNELLDQLSELDMVSPPMTAGAALARLRELATDSLFQPQATGSAPIQMLGLFEAAGERFDHLWLLGMTDTLWPPPPRPNPFLPQALQARLGLPHASAERELGFARRLLQRILAGAGEALVSTPLRQADEALRPSPLILELAPIELSGLALYTEPGYAALIQRSGRIEQLDDSLATPVPAPDQVRGGAALFQDQIECPYRAFAHHRLDASAPEPVEDGPDALVRGLLMHEVMEQVWRRLGDSDGLHGIDPSTWNAMLRSLVETAIEGVRRQYPGLFEGAMAAIEAERLCERVHQWLALEVERPAFSVQAMEQARQLEVGPLKVNVRLDRIDAQPDGTTLIIDYKTGACSARDLLDARPGQPQLPLYAAFSTQAPDGVALASLRVGNPGFHGLGSPALSIQGVTALDPERHGYDWDALLEAWRRELTQVAEDFATGKAAVAPRGPGSCQYCDLPILCRIELNDQDEARQGGGDHD